MNAIRSKLAIVIVLLLSVVILIPSASSKYVKSYRSILKLETSYSYYYVWYNTERGSVSPTTYEITYDANDDSLKDLTVAGRYLIMVKGGNGGDGIDTVSGTFIEGGYGGVMAGIVDFDPKTQVLHVYLGNSGKDAMSGYSTAWANSSGGKNAVTNLYVDAANTWKKADTLGGGGNSVAVSSYTAAIAGGGGGSTLLFLTGLNESISLDNLLLVSGGGGSAGCIVSSTYKSAGVGGSGGSNVISSSSVSSVFKNRATIDGATSANYDTFGYNAGANPGVVYFAWDGTSDSDSAYGSGATNTHGTLGYNRGSGMIAHGDAGYGGVANIYGGAGGGGFFGGNSGTTDLSSGASGGGGGGSSFFSKKVESVPLSTYIDNISAAFDQMGWLRCSSRPDGLLTVNADGTVIDNSHGHLEDYTYVVLAYVGPST